MVWRSGQKLIENIQKFLIYEKKDPPSDADKWQNVEDKYVKHFSDKPGR